jgi:hypothetical protein
MDTLEIERLAGCGVKIHDIDVRSASDGAVARARPC